MVAEEKAKSQYEGYVCPTCRLLFATDLHQVGSCVLCPGCETPVKIPLVGEEEDYLRIGRSRKYVQAGVTADGEVGVGDFGSRSREWDRAEVIGEGLVEKQSLPWVWIVPIFLLGLCLVGVMISVIVGSKPVAPVDLEPSTAKVEVNIEEQEADQEVVDVYDSKKHSELLEESLKGFLAATSVDELLPLIRKTEGVEKKMRAYYETRKFGGKKFKSLERSSGMLDKPSMVVFTVQFSDYTSREGYGELKDGRVLIDWEAFVIYSEMAWDDIAEKKPTEAVEIWAIAVPSNYYNFGFTDDKWAAYELISPDEDRSFIGYVKRNSAGRARLTTFGDSTSGVRCILKIKYPEGAKASNQVLIEEVVGNKWILDTKEEDK